MQTVQQNVFLISNSSVPVTFVTAPELRRPSICFCCDALLNLQLWQERQECAAEIAAGNIKVKVERQQKKDCDFSFWHPHSQVPGGCHWADFRGSNQETFLGLPLMFPKRSLQACSINTPEPLGARSTWPGRCPHVSAVVCQSETNSEIQPGHWLAPIKFKCNKLSATMGAKTVGADVERQNLVFSPCVPCVSASHSPAFPVPLPQIWPCSIGIQHF